MIYNRQLYNMTIEMVNLIVTVIIDYKTPSMCKLLKFEYRYLSRVESNMSRVETYNMSRVESDLSRVESNLSRVKIH